jgi:recombinational DNA repair protein RecR
MTRRFTTCRCCGGFAASAYCDNCSARHAQRIAVAQAAVAALWGADGVARFKAELRARRLSARRTTTRRTA